MDFKDKDHFSGHADRYQASRPTYPVALFAYLSSLCLDRGLAWDCATGNGQAAVSLAAYFSRVFATDASQKQIDHACHHENIQYCVAPADVSTLADASVDLVTVAQAVHWFDLPRFYAEARRVARPNGVIAVWCYQLHTITAEIDAIVDHFYADIVGGRLASGAPAGRGGVQDDRVPVRRSGTAAIPDGPSVELEPRVLGYLESWSATQRYLKRTGANPLDPIRGELATAWGEPEKEARRDLAIASESRPSLPRRRGHVRGRCDPRHAPRWPAFDSGRSNPDF